MIVSKNLTLLREKYGNLSLNGVKKFDIKELEKAFNGE